MPMLMFGEAEVIDTTDFGFQQMRRNSRQEYGGKQYVCRNMEFLHKSYCRDNRQITQSDHPKLLPMYKTETW